MIIIVIIITILDLWEAWGRTWWHSRGRLTPVFPPQPGKTFGIIILWICFIKKNIFLYFFMTLKKLTFIRLPLEIVHHFVEPSSPCFIWQSAQRQTRLQRRWYLCCNMYLCWGVFAVISLLWYCFCIVFAVICIFVVMSLLLNVDKSHLNSTKINSTKKTF